jgi:hypothetical protein
MKVATWNIKQAVAPKKPLEDLWEFAAYGIGVDVMVFTEGKVPADGLPDGWTAVWRAEGIGERRRWGTVIAARNGVELVDITNGVDGDGGFVIGHSWPGTVTIVDVVQDGETVLTVAGVYGITQDGEGNKIGSGQGWSHHQTRGLGCITVMAACLADTKRKTPSRSRWAMG